MQNECQSITALVWNFLLTAEKSGNCRHCHRGNNKGRKMDAGTVVIDSGCGKTISHLCVPTFLHVSFYFLLNNELKMFRFSFVHIICHLYVVIERNFLYSGVWFYCRCTDVKRLVIKLIIFCIPYFKSAFIKTDLCN